MNAHPATPAVFDGYDPARAMASVGRWIRRSIEEGGAPSADQARCWADAVEAAASKAAAQLQAAGAPAPRDRVSAEGAGAIYDAALCCLARLADHAVQAATLEETEQIRRDVESLVNAMECLAQGVVRAPEPTLEGA
ncbi:MAG: hypothetical protein KIS81_00765 [Maricaulaceae bacterium]|nr:hypothetical protein [Maricaulaceae bacterium]